MNIPSRLPNISSVPESFAVRPAGPRAGDAAPAPVERPLGSERPQERPDGLPGPLGALLERVQARLEGRLEQGDLNPRQENALGNSLGSFESALQALADAGTSGELSRDEVSAGARKAFAQLQESVRSILGGDEGAATDPFGFSADTADAAVDRIG